MIHLALGIAGLIFCTNYFARRYPAVAYAIGAFTLGAIVARLTT
jgi:hypothetical protein